MGRHLMGTVGDQEPRPLKMRVPHLVKTTLNCHNAQNRTKNTESKKLIKK